MEYTMDCTSPIRAFQLIKKREGKAVVCFKESEIKNRAYKEIFLSCGQCIGCRINKAMEWAVRCQHESSLWKNNCFLTLTYNEDNLRENKSLVKRDFQLFMKRLRSKYKGIESIIYKGEKVWPIRYFACGEYGELLERPHHHVCLFNFDFRDKRLWRIRNGNRYYISSEVDELWTLGYHLLAAVTFDVVKYVAKYICKKITGSRADEHYTRLDNETGERMKMLPEYSCMSRRPGIGYFWFKRYFEDIYGKDFLTIEGKKYPAPKYYDGLFKDLFNERYLNVKYKRELRSVKRGKKSMRDLKRINKVRERNNEIFKKNLRSMNNDFECI